MEIEEAKKLKAELETKICDLVNEFTAKTGIELDGMNLIMMQREKKEMDLVIFESHDCRNIMLREEAEDKAHDEARYFAIAALLTKYKKEFLELWDKEYGNLKKVRIMPVEKYRKK